MIVIVILLRVLAISLVSGQKFNIEFYRFCYLRLGDSLTSFNQDNSANFFGEKDVQRSYPGCLLFENTRKNFKSNLALVVVLVLEDPRI